MLAPELAWLERLEPAIEQDVDYYAVTPETLWAPGPGGALVANGYHRRFAALRERTRRPFVAHSVGMSLGGVDPSEEPRRAAFVERMRADHAIFDFGWWTDHLGLVSAAGSYLALPLPLPSTRAAASAVCRVLASMREVVPRVGVENSALYFAWGDPLDEPALLHACIADEGSHVLLDLHNLWTSARNLGFDPDAWLARIDLSRVIEIHVSGGSESPREWLPDDRSLRLDSHDDAVPEPVWDLLERVVPRCPALRGVTLERMEGTVDAPDVAVVRDELRRIRDVVTSAAVKFCPVPDLTTSAAVKSCPVPNLTEGGGVGELREREQALAALMSGGALDADGVELARLLVARLRFDRLLAGSRTAAALYDADGAAFAETFRRYAAEVRPTAFFPHDEGAFFEAWAGASPAH
jgi:hypothetical protein